MMVTTAHIGDLIDETWLWCCSGPTCVGPCSGSSHWEHLLHSRPWQVSAPFDESFSVWSLNSNFRGENLSSLLSRLYPDCSKVSSFSKKSFSAPLSSWSCFGKTSHKNKGFLIIYPPSFGQLIPLFRTSKTTFTRMTEKIQMMIMMVAMIIMMVILMMMMTK